MEETKKIQNQTKRSLKWSSLGEIIGRLITPITTAILSRLLLPEVFGIATTVTMIITFCEIFTDGGFAKYIVQKDFASEEEKQKSMHVAFWVNFGLSLVFFAVLCIFANPISALVGNAGHGLVLIIAGTQIPIAAFTSIQTAYFRREFKFKNLFFIRILTAGCNLVISVPMAFLGCSYWSIVVGNLVGVVLSGVVMFFISDWKPKFFFSSVLFKKMFLFSFWNLLESLLIWLCSWASSFIIGTRMNDHYLGIYKNSMSMINALFGIITAAIMPVLFSSLSRLKNDDDAFNEMLYKMQKLTSYILMPMGIGLFLYRDLATRILFGSAWGDAAIVIGIAGISRIFVILFSNFASEVYRSKGKPRISALAQALMLVILIPTCYLTVDRGFSTYVLASSLATCSLIIFAFICLKSYFKIPIVPIIRNAMSPLICSLFMFVCALALQRFSTGYLFDFISMLICVGVYLACYYLFFPRDFKDMIHFFFKRHQKKKEKDKLVITEEIAAEAAREDIQNIQGGQDE